MRTRPTAPALLVVAALACSLLAGCAAKTATTSGPLPSSKLKPSTDEFCNLVAQYESGPEQDLVSSNDIKKVRQGAHALTPVVARLAIVAPKAIHADMAQLAASWTTLTKQADAADSVSAFEAASKSRSATALHASTAIGAWAQQNC
ncbi:MAG TPA: hypothetical protein VGM93_01750 [Acidimicrobiales bacterium]